MQAVKGREYTKACSHNPLVANRQHFVELGSDSLHNLEGRGGYVSHDPLRFQEDPNGRGITKERSARKTSILQPRVQLQVTLS